MDADLKFDDFLKCYFSKLFPFWGKIIC